MPPGKPHSRWRPVRRTVYLNRIRDHHHAGLRTDQARQADDVDAIRALVEPLEQSGALIPRSIHAIEQHLEDYLVLDLEEHSLAAARCMRLKTPQKLPVLPLTRDIATKITESEF